MRAFIVKERTEHVGQRCRHCPVPIRVGHSIIAAKMPTTGYRDPWFRVHAECMAALVADAPSGAPVTSTRAAVGRFQKAAAAVAAGASPFDVAV